MTYHKLQKGKVVRQSERSIAQPSTILSVNLDWFIAQEESGGIVAWQQNGRSHSVRDHWFAKIPMVLGSVTGDEELLDPGPC
jgi:hypothetical protein